MHKDKEFLKANELMDYSVFIIFFRRPEDEYSFDDSSEMSGSHSDVGSHKNQGRLFEG
jgi:FPC/CPF motif-containing protein YcgG